MSTRFDTKTLVSLAWQIPVASIGFIISAAIANAVLPMPEFITSKMPTMGFLSMPAATLLNGIVNGIILVWAARRSSFRAAQQAGQLFILSFGAQTFQTQVETGYFLSAFPLLQNSFELYRLMLRGLITSAIFSVLITFVVGGFSKSLRPTTAFMLDTTTALRHSAWLAGVYFVLYMLFGYYVAWQSSELRLFYGGTEALPSFGSQFLTALRSKPELPVFQYFRGLLWIGCLLPLFAGFSGKRYELIALSGMALGLLPTAQLAFPNPLMPSAVSLQHFWEVSLSTGIFGILCARFIPRISEKNMPGNSADIA